LWSLVCYILFFFEMENFILVEHLQGAKTLAEKTKKNIYKLLHKAEKATKHKHPNLPKMMWPRYTQMASIRPKAYPCLKIPKNNPATQNQTLLSAANSTKTSSSSTANSLYQAKNKPAAQGHQRLFVTYLLN